VVGTGGEEIVMVDVTSGCTFASKYLPRVKLLPKITDSIENFIS
jgi:hypothetical protein